MRDSVTGSLLAPPALVLLLLLLLLLTLDGDVDVLLLLFDVEFEVEDVDVDEEELAATVFVVAPTLLAPPPRNLRITFILMSFRLFRRRR